MIGTNDVGKSSLIKSIYHTLGADVSFGSKWEDADVISLLKVDIDGKELKFLKSKLVK